MPGLPAPFLAPSPPADLVPGEPPTFSVLIPAYEAAATIGAALASLRAQTAPPAEILVFDDGSADDLAGALEPFAGEIRLLGGRHRGVAGARNELLRAASSDFVAPLDADDVYGPTRLQRLAQMGADRPDLDLLATDATFVSAGRPAGRFNERTPFASTRQAEAILDRCFLLCPAMRRERLLALGGYDESLRTAEDWDVCIRLILDGAAAGLVDEPLMEYRLGGESLTADRVETLGERVQMLAKAVALPGLDPPVRAAAEAALGRHRARALGQAARDAVAAASPAARAHLLELARCPSAPPRSRLGALVASLAPRYSGRLVEATVPGSTGRPARESGGESPGVG